MENEFTNKGIAILYKKTNFTTKSQNLQLGFLSENLVQVKLKHSIKIKNLQYK
jgi:hypothetical protein